MLINHPEAEKKLGMMFDRNNPNKLWSSFEESLEYIDVVDFIENYLEQMASMNQVDMENTFCDIHQKLQGYFMDWILQINMDLCNDRRLKLNPDAYFLTFNYTNLLERVYRIPNNRILHIHGDTMNTPSRNPVVGHARKSNPIEKQKDNIDKLICERELNAHTIERITNELNYLWDGLSKQPSFLERTYDEISNYYINEHKNEFDQYKDLSDIFVLGHSLADVDRDYFEYVYKLSPNACWHLALLNPSERISKIADLCKLITNREGQLKVKTFMWDDLLIKEYQQ